jgi:hypothetical protein
MIYRNMYAAYTDGAPQYVETDAVITASAGYADGITYLYMETTDPSVGPEDIVAGGAAVLPDGSKWLHLPEIFHYYPVDGGKFRREVSGKQPIFALNKLEFDRIGSYVYWHYIHQEGNQYNIDRFYCIFQHGDKIISYREEPEERVTWAEREGQPHNPVDSREWDALMETHFKAWPDGTKRWVQMDKVDVLRAAE